MLILLTFSADNVNSQFDFYFCQINALDAEILGRGSSLKLASFTSGQHCSCGRNCQLVDFKLFSNNLQRIVRKCYGYGESTADKVISLFVVF